MVLKTSARLKIPVNMVGNSYSRHETSSLIKMICVPVTFDAADNYIADAVQKNELVITSDVLLASRIVSKGALAISTHGEIFNPENIGERVATRNLMHEMRDSGPQKGGERPYSDAAKKKFAASLDKTVTRLILLDSRK